jgi:hypothetical protein
MSMLYPQSVIIGTLLEFAFFGTCGAILSYFFLYWYEGDRLPMPSPTELYPNENIFYSPEWDRLRRFSIRAGILIGIIAVLIVGPVTAKQAITSFSNYLNTASDDDDYVQP